MFDNMCCNGESCEVRFCADHNFLWSACDGCEGRVHAHAELVGFDGRTMCYRYCPAHAPRKCRLRALMCDSSGCNWAVDENFRREEAVNVEDVPWRERIYLRVPHKMQHLASRFGALWDEDEPRSKREMDTVKDSARIWGGSAERVLNEAGIQATGRFYAPRSPMFSRFLFSEFPVSYYCSEGHDLEFCNLTMCDRCALEHTCFDDPREYI